VAAGAFLAGALLAAGAFLAGAFFAAAAVVAFVVEPPAGVAVVAVAPRVPTALRGVAAACLATDNASLATMVNPLPGCAVTPVGRPVRRGYGLHPRASTAKRGV